MGSGCPPPQLTKKGKGRYSSSWEPHLRATALYGTS